MPGIPFLSNFLRKDMIFMKDPKTGKELPKGISWKKDKQLYMARFTHQGQSYTFYDKDLRSIKKTLADKKYEIQHGLEGKADKISLDKWYGIWMQDYKVPNVKETTVHTYKQMYSCYIEPTLGGKYLSQVKPVHIQKVYNDLLERGLSAKSISNIQGMLYDIFETACRNDVILKNPCKGITRPKVEQTNRRVLSVEEQHTLVSYLKKDKFKPYEPLIVTLLGTGLRIGEALGLTWDDIDFKNEQIAVNKTLVYVKDLKTDKYVFKFQTPKTKNSLRTIPMLSDVKRALKHQKICQNRLRLYMGNEWQPLKGFEDIVFTSLKGRPYQECDIRHFLINIVAEINADEQALAEKENREPVIMEHVHPHALRHTFATRCFERDIPPKTVQHLLGHASARMTLDLYTHVSEQKKLEDMKKLEGLFSA